MRGVARGSDLAWRVREIGFAKRDRRRFFDKPELESAFCCEYAKPKLLHSFWLWDSMKTDWICLDGGS